MSSVTVVIPALRVDERLRHTLRCLAAQALPDGTQFDVVVALAEDARDCEVDGLAVRWQPNPGGSIPRGLNAAIAVATAEVIVRVDARCDLPAGYVGRILEVLSDPAVGCVGGAQLVLDRGLVGSAYAVAFNSPLLGPSAYRYSRNSGPTHSPYLGAWRREVLRAVGGFDERLSRNQDNELAARIAASGWRVVYDASLVVGYFADRTLLGVIRHHWDFGRWRARQRGLGQRSLAPKQLLFVGAAAVVALCGLAVLAWQPARPFGLGAVGVGYVAATAIALHTATRLRRARPDLRIRPLHPLGVVAAPLLAAVLDTAWLAGIAGGSVRATNGTPTPRR